MPSCRHQSSLACPPHRAFRRRRAPIWAERWRECTASIYDGSPVEKCRRRGKRKMQSYPCVRNKKNRAFLLLRRSPLSSYGLFIVLFPGCCASKKKTREVARGLDSHWQYTTIQMAVGVRNGFYILLNVRRTFHRITQNGAPPTARR